MNLAYFNNLSLQEAGKQFFADQLGIKLTQYAVSPVPVEKVLAAYIKEADWLNAVKECYFLGLIDEITLQNKPDLFANQAPDLDRLANAQPSQYKAVAVFTIAFHKKVIVSKTLIAAYTRALNRWFKDKPVILLTSYSEHVSFSTALREPYKRPGLSGEKVSKISMLKDINIALPHTGHLKILSEMNTLSRSILHYKDLYDLWKEVFDIQTLNNSFYKELQDWFEWATQEIKLPFVPDHISKEENTKNFLVRTLARTMFCWFLKEKGLIQPELLELENFRKEKYPLTNDIGEQGFLKSNSYYRGVLQNIFFNSLNKPEKKSKKDFKWSTHLHKDFNYEWLINIPYLNGGIFDELKPDDNARESIEDSVLKIPNSLFYGDNIKEVKGLNQIFNSYKFTIEENTPYEEDIALDPELLGLVFENLLAELDPNLEESTIRSIRRLTGAYYTPRKVIQEMVNESLLLYLNKYFEKNDFNDTGYKKKLHELMYNDTTDGSDINFCETVVDAFDHLKILDPACGSGAFPMGMLHKMVDVLKLVDPDNSRWVELKLEKVDRSYKAEFKKILTQHMDDYSRKLGIIRDSIYGIDIQPLAVQITKLRFFISLLIDQKQKTGKAAENFGITPMPNIETKIICADTLRSFQTDLFAQTAIEELKKSRLEYYRHQVTPDERDDIAAQIAGFLHQAFPQFASQITGKKEIPARNKALLKEWFEHATVAAPFFNMDFFFPEVKEAEGFDIVIGNPPYGGTKISDDVREALSIESKDPYGAFIARFLSYGNKNTPLKHGGVLAYIVSDTFMTIKTHLPLRRQMMDNYLHKMIRVHPDTFRATVNTVIIIAERNQFPNKKGIAERIFNEEHKVLMADLTNVSIHEDYNRFVELLHQAIEEQHLDAKNGILASSSEYAIYVFLQALINTNNNRPFFVSCPKLFSLMCEEYDTVNFDITDKRTFGKQIIVNEKKIDLIKIGNFGETKQGIKTGDNESYIYQNPIADGNYASILDYEKFLLSEKDLESIRQDEKLRIEIIENGISNRKTSKRYFGGKYIVPLDKGGESDSTLGFIPNYFVKTDYYIDWSEWAVNRMKTLTTRARNKEKGLTGGDNSICSRFQNVSYSFLTGITYSPTGIYAPSFRINSQSIFESKGSTLFIDLELMNINTVLGFLCSKLVKYIIKNNINHTVESGEKSIEEIPVPFTFAKNNRLENLVAAIIQKQEKNTRYDYASHEQIEIDKLVYEAYGLNNEDMHEVETWYKRRYPKLARAQEDNLKKVKVGK